MSSGDLDGRKAFERLSRYLQANDWHAERVKDQTAYKAKKDGELCPLKYYFQIKEELEQFLFYIVPHINVFEQMLPSVAEYVCRANHGLRIGNFEVDFSDGQISFKSSVSFKGMMLTETLIHNVIAPALTAFDEFFPGLANVIAGIDTPAKAIRKIEYGE